MNKIDLSIKYKIKKRYLFLITLWENVYKKITKKKILADILFGKTIKNIQEHTLIS